MSRIRSTTGIGQLPDLNQPDYTRGRTTAPRHPEIAPVPITPASTRSAFILTGLILATATLVPVAYAQDNDYLPGDLRVRVEKLKVDVNGSPSNTTNREERARTLWDWANAYSLGGGVLPVNLTQAVTAVFAYADEIGDRRRRNRRLRIRTESARRAAGRHRHTEADLGPFEARTFVTINQPIPSARDRYRPGAVFSSPAIFSPTTASGRPAIRRPTTFSASPAAMPG